MKFHTKRYLILWLILSCAGLTFAQNLVTDPGFENHLPLISIGFNNWDNSKNWKNEGFFVAIYDTAYVYNKEELSRGYDKYDHSPHSGKAVALLPAFLQDSRGSVVGGGFAGYLYELLHKPLEKEQYYHIKLWIKLLDRFKLDRSKNYDYLKHFGVSFCNERPLVTNKAPFPALIYSDAPFLLDTILFEQWVQLDYIIKPTINLKYINIGWFDNPNDPAYRPNTYGSYENEYLLDDILVEKISEPGSAAIKKAIEWPYLNAAGKVIKYQPPVPKNPVINFDFNASTLSASGQATLDSFILQIKKNTPDIIYEIAGYADSLGTSAHNEALSMERALAVKHYLIEKGHFPDYQFSISAKGSKDFIAENQTDEGRRTNRRTEILESETPLSQWLYHTATYQTITGQPDSAFYFLQLWVKMPISDKMLLLHDPDLLPLHTDKRWAGIEHFVKAAYGKYKKPALALQWDNLYCLDQRFRSLDKVYYEAKGCTPADLDSSFLTANSRLQSYQDSAFVEMEQLLKIDGWPIAAEVGERAAEVPMLILCHSIDTVLMNKYLPIFKKMAAEGKIKNDWVAMLTDKILMLEKQVQRYGTQLCPQADDPMEYHLCPIENPEKVNELRASLGLGPVDLNQWVHMRYRPTPCKWGP